LLSWFYWEQRFGKVRKSSRTLELFEGFECNIGKLALGLLPPPSNLPNKLCMFLVGEKGPEWDHVIVVEQKKEDLKVQCKCRFVQILSSLEMCDKSGLKTKETSWSDTDYRSYFIYKSLNMLL